MAPGVRAEGDAALTSSGGQFILGRDPEVLGRRTQRVTRSGSPLNDRRVIAAQRVECGVTDSRVEAGVRVCKPVPPTAGSAQQTGGDKDGGRQPAGGECGQTVPERSGIGVVERDGRARTISGGRRLQLVQSDNCVRGRQQIEEPLEVGDSEVQGPISTHLSLVRDDIVQRKDDAVAGVALAGETRQGRRCHEPLGSPLQGGAQRGHVGTQDNAGQTLAARSRRGEIRIMSREIPWLHALR